MTTRTRTRILAPLFVLLACGAGSPLCAHTIDDGVMLAKHEIFAGNVYAHESWDHYWEGTLERTNGNIGTLTTHTNVLTGNYGVTDRLNVLAAVPYVWTRASQGVLQGMGGWQDITFAAKYRLFDHAATNWSTLRAIGVASGGVPLTDYTPDFQPLSIGTWETKYFYFNPRPSQLDPEIRTAIGLPNFPSYESGHSTFSGAAAEVLSYLFPGGAADFEAQKEEAAISRLYAAIHYRSDIEVGKDHGKRIGAYAVRFAMQDGADPVPPR